MGRRVIIYLIVIAISISFGVFCRHLYELSWFSNIILDKTINLSDAFFGTSEIIVTILIGWYITNRLTSSRYEKEFAIDELKKLVVLVNNYKSSPEDYYNDSQKILDSCHQAFRTIEIFHPKIDSRTIKTKGFRLYGAATNHENPDNYLIKQKCNALIQESMIYMKIINH